MFNLIGKSDSEIQKDVRSELQWDPSVVSQGINANVRDGVVTLAGIVPRFYLKYNAEDAARRVRGVKSIDDQLEVMDPDSYASTDDEVAEMARQILKWNYQVPDGVHVVVDNGRVTLSGVVDWDYQRAAAAKAVSSLVGVFDVVNDITIKETSLDSSEVRSQIENSLGRLTATAEHNIGVSVVGDTVTLSGSLNSSNEIEAVRIAAWNAPGIRNVVNQLKISPIDL